MRPARRRLALWPKAIPLPPAPRIITIATENTTDYPSYLVLKKINDYWKIINEGDLITTEKYLGRYFKLTGKVVKGDGLGKKINYPTANLLIKEKYKIIPKDGVYFIKTKVDNKLYNGMMNIGIRPTVDGQKKVIEVHILDFDQDIYEQNLTVMVYEYIRGEVKFDGLEALKAQLAKDKITTAAILKKYQ